MSSRADVFSAGLWLQFGRTPRHWLFFLAGCSLIISGCGDRPAVSQPAGDQNADRQVAIPASPQVGSDSQNSTTSQTNQAAQRRAAEIASNMQDEPEMVIPDADPQAFASSQTGGESNPRVQMAARPAGPELATLPAPAKTPAELEALGFRVITSPHIVIVTDLPLAEVAKLPELGEALLQRLQNDFYIKWPENQQLTGYVMSDMTSFRETGLLPEDLPGFLHGRHRGSEFWMKMQATPYYLRHLFLHELTHVVTLIGEREDLPVGFKEGIAEWYATNYIDEAGKPYFGVLPGRPEDFSGWGRIGLIQEDLATGKGRSFADLLTIDAHEFSTNDDYAWAWLWIQFCSQHPTYGPDFAKLRTSRTLEEFLQVARQADQTSTTWLSSDWLRLSTDICFGYDTALATTLHRPMEPLADQPVTRSIAAKAGWQSTGLLVPQGTTIRLRAKGQVELNRTTRPWISQPQGISVDYANGQKLGRLMAWWGIPDLPLTAHGVEFTEVIPAGQIARLTAPRDAVLFLRINDHFYDLANNSGEYEVVIEQDVE